MKQDLQLHQIEWNVGILANSHIFDEKMQATLVACRDIVAALRASYALPDDIGLDTILAELWKKPPF